MSFFPFVAGAFAVAFGMCAVLAGRRNRRATLVGRAVLTAGSIAVGLAVAFGAVGSTVGG